jgi:hypothetical protein
MPCTVPLASLPELTNAMTPTATLTGGLQNPTNALTSCIAAPTIAALANTCARKSRQGRQRYNCNVRI